MPADDRGGLKAAFTNFNKPESEREAELKLLGRVVEEEPSIHQSTKHLTSLHLPDSYPVATSKVTGAVGGLTPKPLLQREAVKQLSFRCPVSTASELKRKAAFNQLEQQEIIVEGIKRVLTELPDPPPGWQA